MGRALAAPVLLVAAATSVVHARAVLFAVAYPLVRRWNPAEFDAQPILASLDLIFAQDGYPEETR